MVFSKVVRNPGRLKGRRPWSSVLSCLRPLRLPLRVSVPSAAATRGLPRRRSRSASSRRTTPCSCTSPPNWVFSQSTASTPPSKSMKPVLPSWRTSNNGKLDFAATSEFALVREGFRRNDLRPSLQSPSPTISVSSRRRDRDIESPADLKGKTIGVLRGTTCEFFLATFLAFSGILEQRSADSQHKALGRGIRHPEQEHRRRHALGPLRIQAEDRPGQERDRLGRSERAGLLCAPDLDQAFTSTLMRLPSKSC